MSIRVRTTQLVKAIKSVCQATKIGDRASSVPGILAEIRGEAMTLKGSNEFVVSSYPVPIESDKDLDILIPAVAFEKQVNIIASLGDEWIEMNASESSLTLKSKNVPSARVSLKKDTAAPSENQSGDWLFEFKLLDSVIKQIVQCVSKPPLNSDRNEPFTHVVHFDFQFEDEKYEKAALNVVGCNGYSQASASYTVQPHVESLERLTGYCKELNSPESVKMNVKAGVLVGCLGSLYKENEATSVKVSKKFVEFETSTGAVYQITLSPRDYIPYLEIQNSVPHPFLRLRVKPEELLPRLKACTQSGKSILLKVKEGEQSAVKLETASDEDGVFTSVLLPADIRFQDLEIEEKGYEEILEIMRRNKSQSMNNGLFTIKFGVTTLKYLEDYSHYRYLQICIGSNNNAVRVLPLQECGTKATALRLTITPERLSNSK